MITSKFFNMGQVVTTRSINDLIAAEQKFAVEVTVALQRFAVKDWGDMDAEDKQTNEDALNYPDDLYVMGALQYLKRQNLDYYKSNLRNTRRQRNNNLFPG